MVRVPVTYKDNYRERLPLGRCPWCKVAKPTLVSVKLEEPVSLVARLINRWHFWATYRCSSCQNMILANFIVSCEFNKPPEHLGEDIVESASLQFFPQDDTVLDESIPAEIAELIQEAIGILHAPRSCVVACGTAVDAMLAVKDIEKGSLNTRIDAAAAVHLITADMAKWAHHIRLERNDGTHRPLEPAPTTDEAQLCIDFTLALAEILFVLPARVTRGIEQARPPSEAPPSDNGESPEGGESDD